MNNKILFPLLLTAVCTACTVERSEQVERKATATDAQIAVLPEPVAETTLAAPPSAVLPVAPVPMPAPSMQSLAQLRAPAEPTDRENYAHLSDNPVQRVAETPVSTFSIDVDTGAYANMRRFLNSGQLPPQDAVRVEEFINYFDYDYAGPAGRETPFSVTTELAPTPWNPQTHLLLVGLQGYDVAKTDLPPANLVFLIDVSGSMDAPDKLGLLKPALKLLSRQMRPQDRVAIAVYAGAAGVVLESTPGDRHAVIETALERLSAGGSTNGGEGIELAYALAQQSYIDGGVNRVIIATDGDFNVGTVNFEALKDLVETRRRAGIALTTLGFGTGNYNDQLMEQLADAGDGNYAYIDTLQEARKVLVREMGSTLLTIARDVKIQIEFNPAVVEEYRLIGYENRALKREDFNNDAVDAGDIGAGHTVTALYEIALTGSGGALNDPLRYTPAATPSATGPANELAFLRLRYKQPGTDTSQLLERPVKTADVRGEAGARLRFAAAVAAFGQRLRGGTYLNGFDYPAIAALARSAGTTDNDRAEFIELVNLAADLDGSGGQALR